MRFLSVLLLAVLAACGSPQPEQAKPGPIVLAASSLQEALTEAAEQWTAQGHGKPVLSFAASSALARQIVEGAPADLFASADEPWMDVVAEAGLVAPGSRTAFLRNRLVLVAPAPSDLELALAPGLDLAAALDGRLAIADPESVPAGKYGKAALTGLGTWDGVAGKLAIAENVRAALALVERGEAPLGIVYATDARASDKVQVISTFPADSHPPITYPLARLTRGTNTESEAFRQFLLSAPARAIFARHGFIVE